MSHLGIVMSYPGGNRDFQVLWPHTARNAGFDRVLVTGPRGTWHPEGSSFFECSKDAYVSGDNLPRKLTDSAEAGLNIFQDASWITVEEFDVWHCRTFERSKCPDNKMCGIRVGGQIAGCESHFFCHWPVSASREVWVKWLVAARQLLKEGRIEKGTPDAFLALGCEVAGIEPHFDAWHGFSRNTIHGKNPRNPSQPDFIPEAREAYRNGCCVFHGVKTSHTYACDVEDTILRVMG